MALCDDGHAVAYEERGSGIPVLFLHGFPHDRSLWAPQLDGLGGMARGIAPDLRGFGRSGQAGPFGMDRYADDACCLLDYLGIDRAVVCGLSMGGYVALALLRRHPARVRALVLADTRATPDDDAGRVRRDELIAVAREHGAAAVAARQIDGMVGRQTRERAPELLARIRAMLERAPVDGIVGALTAMRDRPDATAMLSSIAVPTLLIGGTDDVITPPRTMRELQAQIRDSTLELLEGAGHLSNLERPAAFNQVLSEFLVELQLA